MLASRESNPPCSRSSAAAVFRPIPTPGMLSTESPAIARTSPMNFGSMSHLAVTSASPRSANASFVDARSALRMPGALDSGSEKSGDELEAAVLARVEEALSRLNEMREEEGRSIGTELRARMANLEKAAAGVEAHRSTILRSYSERLQSRMHELLGAQVDKERILQEVAVLVDRSDIQEELVRLNTHVKHFLGLLDEGGEVGKKM